MEYSVKSMIPVSQMQPMTIKNGKATSENSTAAAPFSDLINRRTNFARNFFKKARIAISRSEAARGQREPYPLPSRRFISTSHFRQLKEFIQIVTSFPERRF
jgi:hypothetical protein